MHSDDLFQTVDALLESAPPTVVLERLASEFRASGRYDLLFEARNMLKRLELSLPLVQVESSSSMPLHLRPVYEEAMVESAREAGQLYLAAGNIAAGYRYLRAIGETAPVASAIEKVEGSDDLEDVIAIAFQEGIHPRKGLELILRHQGICRAITAFGMTAVEKDREACMALLVGQLHSEIVERMSGAIERQEGASPAPPTTLTGLMAGRPWLFGDYDTYVDTSHLTSVIPYCLELTDEDTLRKIDDLCAYGRNLSPNFAFHAEPPFEDGYADYGHHVKAVLHEDEEDHIQHFRDKAASADPETAGTAPAQMLVTLLARLGRNEEALDTFLQYLADENPAYLRCPNALQLCYAAQNYPRLRDLARTRGDLLSYTAASLMTEAITNPKA